MPNTRNCLYGEHCEKTTWDQLSPIEGEEKVRFCRNCEKPVFLSEDGNALLENLRKNRCVAVPAHHEMIVGYFELKSLEEEREARRVEAMRLIAELPDENKNNGRTVATILAECGIDDLDSIGKMTPEDCIELIRELSSLSRQE